MDIEAIIVRTKQTIIILMLLMVGAAIGASVFYIIEKKSIISIFENKKDDTIKDNDEKDDKEKDDEEIIDDEVDELTEESIKNAEYRPINYDEKTIKLNNGIYTKESLDYIGIYDNEIAFADLNEDGKEEALVILDSYFGGDAHLYELAIVVNKNGKPFHADSEFLGDRVVINSLTIESNDIHINLITHGENDEICCPSVKTVFQYVFSENQLKKVSQYALDIDETASWSLRRNEENKFEIKYPDNFFFQEPEITISKIADKNSIKDCVARKFSDFEVKKVKINNISYCVAESSGVVAGIKYVDSSYTGIINQKLVTLHFVLKYKNCETFGPVKSPEYILCEYLNSDAPRVTEKIVSTFKLADEPKTKK